jgi:hypothetical protein
MVIVTMKLLKFRFSALITMSLILFHNSLVSQGRKILAVEPNVAEYSGGRWPNSAVDAVQFDHDWCGRG